MHAVAPSEYLATEVMTAPPQKLQLLLIEAALRFAAKAKEHWRAGENVDAGEAILRVQQIVSDIMAGIRPEADCQLAAKVSAIYAFVFRCLVAAHLKADTGKLDEAVSVLEIERETWRALCIRLAESTPPVVPSAPLANSGFSLQA